MKILRYTESVQKQLNSKTKSEPWLHVVIKDNGEYAIYVWDTRKVIETGKTKETKFDGCTEARDNHKALVNLPSGMEFDFKSMQKLPRFKTFSDGHRTGCYRHGYLAIVENGKVVRVYQVGDEFIKDCYPFKRCGKDEATIKAIIEAVKALKEGKNTIKYFDNWYFIK